MVTGWFFLTGLLLRPQLCGEGFVLRGFFKMVGAAPQTPEAQVQGWFLLLTKRPAFQVFHKLTRFFFLFFPVYTLVYKSGRPRQTWL